MKKNQLSEVQNVWITAFANELRKLLKDNKDCEDICSKIVLKVLEQIDKQMDRYPNHCDAASAMCFTGAIDYGRSEAKQRGQGVSRKRHVCQLPSRVSSKGEILEIDIIDRSAIDPEVQAVQRDLCCKAIRKINSVAGAGLILTEMYGYDQASAAKRIGVTRTYLCRQMKKVVKQIRFDEAA